MSGIESIEPPKTESHFWQNAKFDVFGKNAKNEISESPYFRASPKTCFAQNEYLLISRQPSLSSKGNFLYSHPISDFSRFTSKDDFVLYLLVLSQTLYFQGLWMQKDLIERFYPLYKVFVFSCFIHLSLGYSFLPFQDNWECLGIKWLLKLFF